MTIRQIATLMFLFAILGAEASTDFETAMATLEGGDRALAITQLEALDQDPRALRELADLYQATDLDMAEDYIERALALQPSSAEGHYLLGVIKGRQAQGATFSALRLAKKSKQAFEAAVQLEPENPRYLQGLMRFHISAPSIAGGDLDIAAEMADRLAVADPISGVLAHADIARALGDDERALRLLEEGLDKHGVSARLAYQAGLHYQGVENFDMAFRHFLNASQAQAADDDIARLSALYQVGRTAVFSKTHTEEGIAALMTYIDTAPSHADLVERPWAEFRLALLYEHKGRVDDAQSIFQRLKDAEDDRLRKAVRKKI